MFHLISIYTPAQAYLCPKPDPCCVNGTVCCDSTACETCVSNSCQVSTPVKTAGAACSYNCECVSGTCSSYVCT